MCEHPKCPSCGACVGTVEEYQSAMCDDCNQCVYVEGEGWFLRVSTIINMQHKIKAIDPELHAKVIEVGNRRD